MLYFARRSPKNSLYLLSNLRVGGRSKESGARLLQAMMCQASLSVQGFLSQFFETFIQSIQLLLEPTKGNICLDALQPLVKIEQSLQDSPEHSRFVIGNRTIPEVIGVCSQFTPPAVVSAPSLAMRPPRRQASGC